MWRTGEILLVNVAQAGGLIEVLVDLVQAVGNVRAAGEQGCAAELARSGAAPVRGRPAGYLVMVSVVAAFTSLMSYLSGRSETSDSLYIPLGRVPAGMLTA